MKSKTSTHFDKRPLRLMDQLADLGDGPWQTMFLAGLWQTVVHESKSDVTEVMMLQEHGEQ